MAHSFFVPAPSELLFKGRPGDPRLGDWVKASTKIPLQETHDKTVIAIAGFPDDEGITRNRGRGGAKGGPDGIRKALYKLCPPMDFVWEDRIELYDAGNVLPGKDIAETHSKAQASIENVAATGATIIALGGGHDFAAPVAHGLKAGREESRKGKALKVGLINVDPHLDVRPLENGLPNSGTPFRVLLDGNHLERLTAFGIRANRNARDHFRYAQDKKVEVLTLESLLSKGKTVEALFQLELKKLGKQCDVIGLTIDLDSCRDMEGTSAAPVLGFSAWDLCRFAYAAGRERSCAWLELAEAAPSLDPADRVSRVAAEIIFSFLLGRAEGTSRTRASRRQTKV